MVLNSDFEPEPERLDYVASLVWWEMPEGWLLEISLKRGGGRVRLFRPDGAEVSIDPGDFGMATVVLRAIAIAKNG
jgi:hypothetical protein